jgi:transposase
LFPAELGWGCGTTCRTVLERWQRWGVWQRLHEVLLAELHEAEQIDWSRAVVDSAPVRAPQGGPATGPNPTDRRKIGSKHHLIVDAHGIPLAATLTGANAHDVTQLLPLADQIPPVRGKRGRPRRRPQRVQGDRAYDSQPHRRELRRRHIEPVLGRRRTEHGSRLGVFRWVVERTLSWFHQMGRLRRRTDRFPEIHRALMSLGCAQICLTYLLQCYHRYCNRSFFFRPL